jgi:hypothetical protein
MQRLVAHIPVKARESVRSGKKEEKRRTKKKGGKI